MAKKDFTEITAIPTGKVNKLIAQATDTPAPSKGRQTTATPEEAAERAAELRTQGRKGCRAVRINMALTPQNHLWIKLLARATGRTQTEIVNAAIEAHRKEHPELLEQAQHTLDVISGLFGKGE